jgi:serine O-acetyltransferase
VITGIEIHPRAVIGEVLFIDHGAGVVIGETPEIGRDVTLYQGVTLGGTGFQAEAASDHRGQRHDRLGAKLLGPITVGHGAKIGANSVVIEDASASTVVGNPATRCGIGPQGRRTDADWIHLPDPLQDAVKSLSARIKEPEKQVADLKGEEPAEDDHPEQGPAQALTPPAAERLPKGFQASAAAPYILDW